MTKGWALGHSIPERIFKAHTKNYLKMYYAIKTYLDTQHVKMLSFNMVPTPTTTVISMNIFWSGETSTRDERRCESATAAWEAMRNVPHASVAPGSLSAVVAHSSLSAFVCAQVQAGVPSGAESSL